MLLQNESPKSVMIRHHVVSDTWHNYAPPVAADRVSGIPWTSDFRFPHNFPDPLKQIYAEGYRVKRILEINPGPYNPLPFVPGGYAGLTRFQSEQQDPVVPQLEHPEENLMAQSSLKPFTRKSTLMGLAFSMNCLSTI